MTKVEGLMRDRAAVVKSAESMERTAADEIRCHATLAARELARGDSDEVLDHLRLALQAAWLEDRSIGLGLAKFTTDAEATAALAGFGSDDDVRDAWVRAKLDAFRKAVAPEPTIVSVSKPIAAALPSSHAVDTMLSTIGLGRMLIDPGHKRTFTTVSQGWLRPLRLFIEPVGDVAVPCEKCGHEAEGAKLSDLRVVQILVGCKTALATNEPIAAHLFSVRHAEVEPPDSTYPVAQPGITIGVILENHGNKPIEVDVALLGEYVRSGSVFAPIGRR